MEMAIGESRARQRRCGMGFIVVGERERAVVVAVAVGGAVDRVECNNIDCHYCCSDMANVLRGDGVAF